MNLIIPPLIVKMCSWLRNTCTQCMDNGALPFTRMRVTPLLLLKLCMACFTLFRILPYPSLSPSLPPSCSPSLPPSLSPSLLPSLLHTSYLTLSLRLVFYPTTDPSHIPINSVILPSRALCIEWVHTHPPTHPSTQTLKLNVNCTHTHTSAHIHSTHTKSGKTFQGDAKVLWANVSPSL